MKFIFALILSLLIPTRALATSYYVQVDQPNPIYGQSVTFTGTAPKEATQSARNAQFHDNPYYQVDCYQNNVNVFEDVTTFQTKAKLGDGWILTSYPFTLGGGSWTGGAADCYVTLWYVKTVGSSYQIITVAQQEFLVSG